MKQVGAWQVPPPGEGDCLQKRSKIGKRDRSGGGSHGNYSLETSMLHLRLGDWEDLIDFNLVTEELVN